MHSLQQFVGKTVFSNITLNTLRKQLNTGYKGNTFKKPKKGSQEIKTYNQKMNMNIVARQKLNMMAQNIEGNTPQIVAGLFLATSLPGIYFYYKAMWEQYRSREFYEYIKKTIDCMNFQNMFLISIVFGLEAVKFCDRRAKHRTPRSFHGYLMLCVPFALHFATISYFDRIEKTSLLTSAVADASAMIIAIQLSNEGLIPFWFFNIRYYVHLFDLFVITLSYYSIQHLNKDMEDNAHQYLKENEKQIEYTNEWAF